VGGLGIWSGSGVVARGDRLVKGGFLFVEQQEKVAPPGRGGQNRRRALPTPTASKAQIAAALHDCGL
jgi:hypothetical protein